MRSIFQRCTGLTALTVLAFGVANCSHDPVSGPVASAVIIAESEYLVGVGATRQLEAFGYDDKHVVIPGATIEWTSSNTSLVTIDAAGVAHGVALGGPVTVTASFSGKSATTRVTAIPASIIISPALDSFPVGQPVQLSAAASDRSGAPLSAGTAAWVVDPSTVATISSSGLVTPLMPGRFTVTAIMAGGAGFFASGVPSPYDGAWSGNGVNGNGQPQALRFTVRYGSITQVSLPNVPTTCGAQVLAQFTTNVVIPITIDRFTYVSPPGSGTLSMAGVFQSPTSVTGNYGVLLVGIIPCPEGGAPIVSAPASQYSATRQ